MTTLGSDFDSPEPAVAEAPPGAVEPSGECHSKKTRRRIIERLDDALATAEKAVLGTARRVDDEPKENASGAEREPFYVSFLKLPRAGPVTALVALMVTYVAVFGTLTYQQQSNYGTYGYDQGIYDQGIWLVSQFKNPFLTIRGLDYFGHHVNIITLIFVPAYWLGAGPHFLYAVETVWLAAGAIPIWLLGRDRLKSAWLPLGLCAAYLLYPWVEWMNWWDFHPDALIITPLMFAYWLATKRRWGWFWVAVAITLSCKEDAGLAVFALGICLWLKHRQRAWGLVTAIAGGTWFLICTKLIIPFANAGAGPFYVSRFSDLGSSIFSIMGNFVIHPSRWIKLVFARSRWTYYAQVFWPVALIALLEPLVLLIGVPQILVNTISGSNNQLNIHYGFLTAIVTAGVFLATVEACAKRGRTAAGRRFMVGLTMSAALASNVAWSPSPISVNFHKGFWLQPKPQDQAIDKAISIVPKNASVSATYNIDDHMTHRVLIYEYPNPWIVRFWGIRDTKPPDPSKVDWLVLDTRAIGNQPMLYKALLKTEFKLVFDEDGILVLHRVRPGIPNDHNWP
jgi:uncharacterized membrane protein